MVEISICAPKMLQINTKPQATKKTLKTIQDHVFFPERKVSFSINHHKTTHDIKYSNINVKLVIALTRLTVAIASSCKNSRLLCMSGSIGYPIKKEKYSILETIEYRDWDNQNYSVCSLFF
jgi:hypothetical protein